ncbi:hypothetical protein GCM10009118_22780 [Wandonia haliotis]|uniref:Secretion system C-terminal sorting domain-containing protein n=1 Tax=Wandonia haliotis TaxID=574963 RepID=A0ABN1MRB0_9FLAO
MKYLRLIWIPILLGLTHNVSGQTEYMINGGFEQWDNDDNNDGIADDYYDHSIEYAVGWHNLINTCDVVHPNYDMISGTPRTGVACGRFGAPQNGMAEFCYGTTQPLTAGDTYRVSFWVRKDYSTGADKQIGVVIAPTVPNVQLSPYSSSIQPLITYVPTGTQYVQVSACFTAQSSGTHYLTFGPFGGVSTPESNIYLIDDVSVTSIDPATQLPVAGLTIPTTAYCVGDAISVDGSSTTNEEGYRWEIVRTSPGGDVRYNSGDQTGQAGTLDVSAVIGTVLPGECYRVSLTALGSCTDRTYVDFCFVNPRVDILHEGTAVCENNPVELTATGDNGWVYTWSNGQSGVGLKTVTVSPTLGNSNYSVTVTTPEGCTFTQSLTLVVHTADNLAPWMDGINGTGEYTYYVSAGGLVSFTSTLYNDDPSEQIVYFETYDIPSSFTTVPPSPAGGTFSFNWQTSPATPPGEYYFTLSADDRNACIPLTGTFTFRIIVVCRYCPICINYEDRTPYNDPLPGETKVGNCIYAGLTDPVETGNADVLFQAGNEIVLGDFFSAGPGFIGEIDPSVCVDDCEECCEEWEGFTLDTPLPDIFTPNDDGLNDFWFVRDEDHPFCAFNAQGFSLLIFNRWGNVVHKLEDYGVGCCSYTAPSPSNPIPYSSIYWDGRDHITGELVTSEAYYFYSITLFGCGWDEHFSGSIYVNYTHQYNGLGLLEQNDAYLLPVQAELREPITMEEGEEENERVRQPSQSAITLSPNPATDRVTIHGLEEPEYDMVLLSGKGSKVLQKKVAPGDNQINISHLAPGTYFVLITTEDTVHFDKLVIN